MRGIAKSDKEETEVGSTANVIPAEPHIKVIEDCPDPTVGSAQVIAYIAGDMLGERANAFVAHASDCCSCLREIALWRMAEEIVDRGYHFPNEDRAPSSLRDFLPTFILKQNTLFR